MRPPAPALACPLLVPRVPHPPACTPCLCPRVCPQLPLCSPPLVLPACAPVSASFPRLYRKCSACAPLMPCPLLVLPACAPCLYLLHVLHVTRRCPHMCPPRVSPENVLCLSPLGPSACVLCSELSACAPRLRLRLCLPPVPPLVLPYVPPACAPMLVACPRLCPLLVLLVARRCPHVHPSFCPSYLCPECPWVCSPCLCSPRLGHRLCPWVYPCVCPWVCPPCVPPACALCLCPHPQFLCLGLLVVLSAWALPVSPPPSPRVFPTNILRRHYL